MYCFLETIAGKKNKPPPKVIDYTPVGTMTGEEFGKSRLLPDLVTAGAQVVTSKNNSILHLIPCSSWRHSPSVVSEKTPK